MSIEFSKADTKTPIKHKKLIISWLQKSVRAEKKKIGDLAFIFCSDEYLLQVNRQYLKHDYYTDVITFDYSEKTNVAGDVFISVDRVRENALIYKTTFSNELRRVMIHGVLHLCGYSDKTKPKAAQMREKEDKYLSLLAKMNR